MDAAPAGPRDLVHRARLQPAGRRLARRLRSAAVLLLLGACAREELTPGEDYLRRFLEVDWEGVETYRAEELVAGLRRYVEGDHPIYPTDDRHCIALHLFLYRRAPDPRPLLPLFAPHAELDDVTDELLRRDVVASSVVTSFIRRVATDPEDPWRRELYHAIAEAGVHFAFDRAYGEAHTETSVDVGDFFAEGRYPACAESREALGRSLEALLGEWRKRVTNKGSSTFFGIVLRHLGRDGAERLAREWGGMNEDERYDLMKRYADLEEPGPGARSLLVDAILDPSLEVRGAALEALARQGAPVAGLDASSRDEAMEKARPALRAWAAETDS